MSVERTVNLLPGPVDVSARVRRALAAPPISHRSAAYRALLDRVRASLIEMTGAAHVQMLLGSGTMANDAVAAQLSQEEGAGLILSNGEFGERLVSHARGFGMEHRVHRVEWGRHWDLVAVERALDRHPGVAWVWAVHCETSTGQVNPVEDLKVLCAQRELLLNLDCVSSLGVAPVDLRGVYLASAVSGKALRALTGLSMVFHAHDIAARPAALPRYLDLGGYAEADGVPFSGSSHLLSALAAALDERRADGDATDRLADTSAWLAAELRREGIPFLLEDEDRSPAVFTIPLPRQLAAGAVGTYLEARGFLLNCHGAYLARKNWIQVCLMSDHDREDLEALVRELAACLHPDFQYA